MLVLASGSPIEIERDVFRMSEADALRLQEWLLRTSSDAAKPGCAGPEQIEAAAAIATALPPGLLRAIHCYRDRGSEQGILLVRNLFAHLEIEPTPVSGLPSQLKTGLFELCLLGLMSLLGEAFTFASLDEGRLVQNIVPRPGHERAQTSMGSDSFLDWHVEDAFTEDRCDYLGLLCMRGEPGTRTIFSAIRNAVLDADLAQVLREARFVVPPDTAHGDLVGGLSPMPVITGPDGDPEICYDAIYMRPSDENDVAAADALRRLRVALTASAGSHELLAGDLLIIDNRRVVHARTPFTPRFDGTDRWLMRTMICSSPATHRRRGGVRVIASA